MPKASSALLLPLFLLPVLAGGSPALAADLHDAMGNAVHVKEHPARIVSLMPSLAELAAEFLPDLAALVGVSDFTTYPPALKKTASVGPYHRFSIEKVASLRPDLALASFNGNSRDQIEHLKELGIPVLIVKTDTFEECAQSIRLVGAALGYAAEGERLATRFNDGIERARARGRERAAKPGYKAPRVLLEVGEDPLVVVGGSNLLNAALSAVGATNIYSDSRAGYPRPSIEDVIARSPDVIIALALSDDTAAQLKSLSRWNSLKQVPAVRNQKVFLLRADALLRPSMRLVEGLGKLESALYGGTP